MENTKESKQRSMKTSADCKSFQGLTEEERAYHMEIADIYANAVSERLEWLLRPIYEEIKAVKSMP